MTALQPAGGLAAAPDPPPIVEVRSVSKIYPGGVEALDGVSLDFPEGRLTTLLGPSGCGKTTLLKIIAGLIPATRGAVKIKGRAVSGPGPERSFVFQDFALLPWATVLRNVAFGLELRGTPKAERETAARHYIGEVGLAGEIRSVPQMGKRLAEAARLGFARAVIPAAGIGDAPAGLQVNAVADLTSALRALL